MKCYKLRNELSQKGNHKRVYFLEDDGSFKEIESKNILVDGEVILIGSEHAIDEYKKLED